MERTSPTLEDVLQSELENSGIDAGGSNFAQRGAHGYHRIVELRVVEGVEELSAEYNRLALGDSGGLHDGNVPIELAGAKNRADAGIAKAGSVAVDSAGGGRAKSSRREIA